MFSKRGRGTGSRGFIYPGVQRNACGNNRNPLDTHNGEVAIGICISELRLNGMNRSLTRWY